MADDVIIRAEGLGKTYVIAYAGQRERYTALRDVIGQSGHALARRLRNAVSGKAPPPEPKREAFRALSDVSFEVRRGEVMGVIGRNGAGKSTLLKVLSRITEPSEGRVTIGGRVASLLEVGTGFHPELTGRENIFLNGSILGMSRGEIRRKFDEIVDFAGVERFVDTPVKRYSSGMQVRLAFSVAAHLEPEILIVDEVLAVGDAEFQKKCLGKMDEVSSRDGRTVLFVSHQLGMVSRLCSRALVLSAGKVDFDGPANLAIERHLASVARRDADTEAALAEARRLDVAIGRVELLDAHGAASDQLSWDQPFSVRIRLAIRHAAPGRALVVAVDSQRGGRVTSWATPLADHAAGAGTAEISLRVSPRILAPGGYALTVAVIEPHVAVLHMLEAVRSFVVADTGSHMTSVSGVDYGVALIPATWSSAQPGAVEREALTATK